MDTRKCEVSVLGHVYGVRRLNYSSRADGEQGCPGEMSNRKEFSETSFGHWDAEKTLNCAFVQALLLCRHPPFSQANKAQVGVHHRHSIPSFLYSTLTTADRVPATNTQGGVHYGKHCVSTSAMAERALPYQEPSITAFLTLSSFLCLLNVINYLLDKWIYCGLLGQVFIGVAWGMPGAQWISKAIQRVSTQLGSLGLVLLVYEGMIAAPLIHHLIG
jgi:hypothetical protein